MTRFMKVGAGIGTAVASLGLLASTALASSTTIYNTGNGVSLYVPQSTHTNVTVNNSNSLYSNQYAINNLNTGFNQSNHNIGGGGIYTGSAYANTTFGVMGNVNWTSIGF